MDVLINGEIYIKNGSEPYHMSERTKDLIYDLDFDASKENPDFVAMEYVDKFRQFEGLEGEDDYSGCNEFWVSMIDENGINMIEQSLLNTTKRFANKQELDKSFTRLTDFLEHARYVGRYFKRTKPVNSNDKSYMEDDNSALVLFATDRLMLIKYSGFDSEKFEMLSPRYFEDGNFEFYGEFVGEYSDKTSLYQAINEQIVSSNKRRSL